MGRLAAHSGRLEDWGLGRRHVGAKPPHPGALRRFGDVRVREALADPTPRGAQEVQEIHEMQERPQAGDG